MTKSPHHEAAPSGVTLRRGLGMVSGVRDALGGVASLKVFIPWLAPSLNRAWAGMHWAARKRIADGGHLIVKTKLRGAPKLTPPVMLIFQPVHPRGRRFDALNYALSAKVIEDGLVRSGLLGDDSGAYVAGVVLLRARRGPETGIWLEVVEVKE